MSVAPSPGPPDTLRVMARDLNLDVVTAQRLRYYLLLAKSKSIREAALEANISPPALTHHIDVLEEALGVRLFARSKQGIAVTAAGRQLVRHGERVLDGLSRFAEYANGIGRGVSGTLSIACYPVHVERFLGPVVQRVLERYPDITFDFTQMRDDRRRDAGRSLISELIDGEVELAMAPPHQHLPGVAGLYAYTAHIVALVRDDHPSRHAGQVPLAELAAEPLLTAPAGYFSRLRLEAIARASGINLIIGAQSSSPLALMVLGKSGLGIPILPDDYPLVGQHLRPYPVVLDDDGREICTPVWLHWRNDEETLPSVDAFIAEARKQVALEERQGRVPQTYYGLHSESQSE